jgi:hypothetical protein
VLAFGRDALLERFEDDDQAWLRLSGLDRLGVAETVLLASA